MGFGNAGDEELPTITRGQVDVPLFTITAADSFHGETCGRKGVIDLVAHLETLDVNTRTYLGNDVGRTGAVNGSHLCYGLLDDALHCSPPTSVNSTDSTMHSVVEQHRNAVCR